MNMTKRKYMPHILWSFGLVLLVMSGAILASPKRLVWEPIELNPPSIAPGETRTFEVTLRNTGPGSFETEHVGVRISGDVANILKPENVKLPKKLKKGASATVRLSVIIPADASLSVVTGEAVLVKRDDDEGGDKDDKRNDHEQEDDDREDGQKKITLSNTLPITLTISSIPLPPDPGEAGKKDLLGIDIGGGPDNGPNGVRDDIDRYIVFNYQDSEKKREALKQEARALTPFLRDADDKAKTRENGANGDKAADCLSYVFPGDVEASIQAFRAIKVQFLNTEERSLAYKRANAKMGGYTPDPILGSEWENAMRAACTFDADAFSN